MPIVTSVQCDECPKFKTGERLEGPSGWYSAIVTSSGFTTQPHYSGGADVNKRFFCSLECLLINLKRWITEHGGKV